MSCENVQLQISSLLDRRLAGEERDQVYNHLASCRKCAAHLESLEGMRAAFRGMDRVPVPPLLASQLRVRASRERVRQLAHVSLSARLDYVAGRLRLLFDNMMRPMALPFAGGLLSAMILFGILAPSLSFHHSLDSGPEMSVLTHPDGRVVGGIGELPRITPVNSAETDDQTVVALTIDEKGRVREFKIEHGEMTRDIENLILFSRFTPATFFGQPIPGRVVVSVDEEVRPSITVRG